MKLFKAFESVKKSLRIAAVIGCLAFIMGGLMLAPQMAVAPLSHAQQYYPGSQAAIFPNYSLPPMVFTATSQTKTFGLGGYATATLQIYGTATACTLQVKVSNDGGTDYFATPYFAGVYTSNVPVIVTGAAFPAYTGTPVQYWVNLAGMTNVEVISSGTFTGTSCTVQITASSNRFLP